MSIFVLWVLRRWMDLHSRLITDRLYLAGHLCTTIWSIDPGLCSRYSNSATGWAVQGSNPGRGKTFLLSKMFRPALGPIKPIHWVQGLLYRRWSDRGVKFTVHLHLVLRLGMKGAIPPVPLCSLMECTGTAVPFILIYRAIKNDGLNFVRLFMAWCVHLF
jgi:hypothetical protein